MKRNVAGFGHVVEYIVAIQICMFVCMYVCMYAYIYIYISIHSHTKALSQLVILITWARDRLLMLGSQYGFPRLDGRGASLLFTMAVSFRDGLQTCS